MEAVLGYWQVIIANSLHELPLLTIFTVSATTAFSISLPLHRGLGDNSDTVGKQIEQFNNLAQYQIIEHI
jgi:hypothetical protein